jgi:hypothetical protein
VLFTLATLHCTGEIIPESGKDQKRSVPLGDGSPPPNPSGEDSGPSNPTSKCEGLETEFEGRCYQATGLSSMDYPTAKEICKGLGAVPVSILSAAENDFVYGLLFHMTSSAWIGLTRSGGDYAWEDGSALGFTNWEPGEPDSRECAVMRGPLASESSRGMWADASCGSKYREVICER